MSTAAKREEFMAYRDDVIARLKAEISEAPRGRIVMGIGVRPEWVKCVSRDGGPTAYCGRAGRGWRFVDFDHARRSIAQETWAQPCEECMRCALQAGAL